MKSEPKKLSGFTLVEISIVMIIIGLLIGGTFGGMKLIENMQVNKTVQDLKAIESAALTFKDTYGRLPGDMPNTAARLPSCTDAPCATGGNGDRILDSSLGPTDPITATSERFTFWHHLRAADILSIGTKNVADLNFGQGQPDNPIDGGYRLTNWNGIDCQVNRDRTQIILTRAESANFLATGMRCAQFARPPTRPMVGGANEMEDVMNFNLNRNELATKSTAQLAALFQDASRAVTASNAAIASSSIS